MDLALTGLGLIRDKLAVRVIDEVGATRVATLVLTTMRTVIVQRDVHVQPAPTKFRAKRFKLVTKDFMSLTRLRGNVHVQVIADE